MTTVRIWFTKCGEAAYISLLDLQRVMGRSLKRSGLPVWYTLGFNPHIYMTFSCPLALGQESLVESVDVKTEEEAPDLAAWQQALARVMPSGIEVQGVALPGMKAEQIGFAEYTIRYAGRDLAEAAAAALEGYNQLESAPVEKKSKRGVRSIDLKEHLPRIEFRRENTCEGGGEGQGESGGAHAGAGEPSVAFSVRLPASEALNLNPALLTGFLQQRFGLPTQAAGILRTALYAKNGESFC